MVGGALVLAATRSSKAAVGAAVGKASAGAVLGLSKSWLVGVAAVVLASLTGGSVYYAHQARVANQQALQDPFDAEQISLVRELKQERTITRYPAPQHAIKTFISEPLDSSRIAWVLDGSGPMAPYFDQVRTLTKTAMLQLQPDEQAFGVVVAGRNGTAVSPIDVAGMHAYEGARDLLDAQVPDGTADIPAAFRAAARQRPDQIFLVTAQPIDKDLARSLKNQAVAIGASVHVISFGNDPAALRTLAKATAGEYKTVNKSQLDNWSRLIASYANIKKLETRYND